MGTIGSAGARSHESSKGDPQSSISPLCPLSHPEANPSSQNNCRNASYLSRGRTQVVPTSLHCRAIRLSSLRLVCFAKYECFIYTHASHTTSRTRFRRSWLQRLGRDQPYQVSGTPHPGHARMWSGAGGPVSSIGSLAGWIVDSPLVGSAPKRDGAVSRVAPNKDLLDAALRADSGPHRRSPGDSTAKQ